METTTMLRQEITRRPEGAFDPFLFRLPGYESSAGEPDCCRRGQAVYTLFVTPTPYVYQNDWIAGSLRPYITQTDAPTQEKVRAVAAEHPERGFLTNFDHYSPDYREAVRLGVPGLLKKIAQSAQRHAGEPSRVDFLRAMERAMTGLQGRLTKYAAHCAALEGKPGYDREKLRFIAENCRALTESAPQTFAQALQLVWMIHTGFLAEGRFAMALGRMDQYLYPFFERDIRTGALTEAFATELLENVFMKIYERRVFLGEDDVVNICIGGTQPDGRCAVNRLSYCILQAVRNCNVPGPNLSARMTPDTPDEFLDSCLQVIGTGLGYPALMNDTVNLEALRRYGYKAEDVYDYSMVGCIENFITGKQPPWSDGRFDTPRFFEYLFNAGKSYAGDTVGLDTGSLSGITTMQEFMRRFEAQLAAGAEQYMQNFYAASVVDAPQNRTSPFLSCFCGDCIGRGLDINMGGSVYPSVHGAALMGVGTVCDSLAAIEKTVFVDRSLTLEELRDAMKANFRGYDAVRRAVAAAPKYGNNDPFVDKYAVWFVDFLSDTFRQYKTRDGGGVYVAMAANINNIGAGKAIGATPDGRLAGEPLSDASSPTYGRDTEGPTATVLSVTKPSYEKVACGSVLNQKFTPNMFRDGKRQKLLQLIRVYFSRGGQEIQINATSAEILKDAMVHPEKYADLVVRVSGFSAFYVTLAREVQLDILHRTQQD